MFLRFGRRGGRGFLLRNRFRSRRGFVRFRNGQRFLRGKGSRFVRPVRRRSGGCVLLRRAFPVQIQIQFKAGNLASAFLRKADRRFLVHLKHPPGQFLFPPPGFLFSASISWKILSRSSAMVVTLLTFRRPRRIIMLRGRRSAVRQRAVRRRYRSVTSSSTGRSNRPCGSFRRMQSL